MKVLKNKLISFLHVLHALYGELLLQNFHKNSGRAIKMVRIFSRPIIFEQSLERLTLRMVLKWVYLK